MEGQQNMLAILLLLWISTASGEYLFTLPRVMETGSKTTFCLVLTDLQEEGLPDQYTVTVELKYLSKDDTNTVELQTATFGVVSPDGDFYQCQEILAPYNNGRFSAVVNATMTYAPVGENDEVTKDIFGAEQDIESKTPALITLVQTDKPIYKPGQMVKFRVMTMDYMLMSRTDGYPLITIESPNGMRVMQWDDVPAPNGLVKLDMQLSSDPILGSWKIKVLYGKDEIVQPFKVDEYVLPKFEVTVTPPKYLLPTTQTISGTVCAKYTYGKPVKGTLKMSVCYKGYSYYTEKRPCADVIAKIDGCYEFFVPANDIKLGYRQYSTWGSLEIEANVTEEETGIQLSGRSSGPRLTRDPISLKIEDDFDNYYKPAFPYSGRVVVTNPDGSPAPGEHIRVEARSTYNSPYKWANNFTSDENGIVHFVIDEFESETGFLNLNAKAIVYETDWRYTDDELYIWTYPPNAYLRLTKWYSPSDSYIYIPDIDEVVECDSELPLRAIFTADIGEEYTFLAIVKAGDAVVHTEKKRVHANRAISKVDVFKDIDESQKLIKEDIPTTPPLPPLPPMPLPELPEASEEFAEEELVEEEIIVPEVAKTLGGEETTRKKREGKSKSFSQVKLKIPVTQEMSPNAKILLFYIRKDKEVVATSVEFTVKNCFKNKVNMSFDETTVRPGANVNLNLGASPSSTCFVGMVDKSVNLLGGSNQLTPKQVFDHVSRVARPYHYISYWTEDREYCKEKIERAPEDEFYYFGYSSPEGVDAVKAFRDVDLWVETDATLESRPCVEQRYQFFFRTGGGAPGSAELGPGGPVPLERQEAVELDSENAVPKSESEQVDTIRTFFPETWLWDIVNIGEDGSLSLETKIPDTITEWVGNTVCTHESDGVGVTDITGVTAFKPFFVSLTLPYSAIRGEVLPVLATVFNYLSDCITLKIRFKQTEGFVFSDTSAHSREFCLCGGESESTKFHIIPTIIGEIDIEVTAVSTKNIELCENVVLGNLDQGVEDGVQRQLLIEAEGMPRDQTKSSYTCVKEIQIITEIVDMVLPPDMVPDSERATVSVVGDIMGPTLSNLKNLLKMPYGCGEQNMASWTPNIYTLQYLESTDQLTKEIEEEAEGYMRVGYQRQMKYRHSDYSYSAWGEGGYSNTPGSSWLTAFVVKSMAQSSAYITIDTDDIVRSAQFLANTQQEDGCFPQVGRVFSSYLKGGLEDDNPAGLTAFILIALLEADQNQEFMNNISNGFSSCLDKFDVSSTDTYTLTLMFYAYSVYDIDGARRAEVMAELDTRKVEKEGLVFWRRDNEEEKPESMYWWYRAPSAEVEMTAYVLLSMLFKGHAVIGDVQPIVQWLTKQRNPYGGFSSTQDTVVALQALAEFGKLTYSSSTAVTVEVKNRAVDFRFSVTPSNSLVYQSADVNPSQGPLEITTTGTGCALIQVNMKYNVYTEQDAGPAFDLNVKTYRSRSVNSCSMRSLEVCASYLKGGVSNMAIIEVKMLTGWTPVVTTLDELVQSKRIQKYEVDKNYVELYFDEFSSKQLCVDFDVEQEIVMNPKPSLVKIYDYYETGYSVSVNYSIKTTCGTKEEIPFGNEGLDCSIMQCRVDTSKPYEMTCPDCPDIAEVKGLEKLLCDAKSVYKAVVGRSGTYSIKLKSDLRTKKKTEVNAFVNYKMDDQCSCPIIESGTETKALIVWSESNFFSGKEWIRLDGGQTVLPYSSTLEGTIRRLSSRQKVCDKLSRLRRSGRIRKLRKLRRNLGVL